MEPYSQQRKASISRIRAGIAPLKTWFRQLSRKIYVATLPAKIPVAGDT
jgi:hypothetical protein